MLDTVSIGRPSRVAAQPATPETRHKPKASFAQMLQTAARDTAPVRFSAHASGRLRERSIDLSPVQENRLREAVDEAAAKGSQSSLLLMDQVAYVVSVPRRTVVTALPVDEMEQRVFTNIDSAVVVPPTATTAQEEPQPIGPAPTWGSPRAVER